MSSETQPHVSMYRMCILSWTSFASAGGSQFKASALSFPWGHWTSRENQNVLCRYLTSSGAFAACCLWRQSRDIPVSHLCPRWPWRWSRSCVTRWACTGWRRWENMPYFSSPVEVSSLSYHLSLHNLPHSHTHWVVHWNQSSKCQRK